MKKFFGQVFASMLGTILLISLCVFGLILFALISVFTTDEKVVDNSVLEINLSQGIIESSSQQNSSLLSFKDDEPVYFKHMIDLINHAKTDNKIKGISLKISEIPAGGYAVTGELRAALQDFKQSKKFVYAYQNDASQKAYYLASVADALCLNPNAMLEVTGMSSELQFVKNFGDKYGIEFDVIRHGKYKAAVEPFLRDNLSDENRFQLTQLTQDLWKKVETDVTASRKIPAQKLNAAIDSLSTFIPEENLKNKLVDFLQYESEYDQMIKDKLGVEKDETPSIISIEDYAAETTTDNFETDKIAILYTTGQIFSGQGDEGIFSKDFIQTINQLKDDEEVKAVVLRVNSPGGSANASDEIFHELLKLKAKKPIVVSFSDVAASGGYYIAMAGNKIFAQENTVTGSIGVFGMQPNGKKLAENLGITSDHVQTHANSLYYSPLQGLTPQGKYMYTKSVEHTYKKFVGVVMQGRKKTFNQIDAVGGGHVWSGKQALGIGLVDQIGGLNQAIQEAAKLAKITQYSTPTYPESKDKIDRFFSSLQKVSLSNILLQGELNKEQYQLYQQIKAMQKNTGVQLILPAEFHIQ